MKKLLNLSLVYAAAGMAAGVFFREFTKFNDFTGSTALGKVHTHLFMLGMFVFLIAALFQQRTELTKQRPFKIFMVIYNIGVPLTAVMMIIRGVFEVTGTELSKGASAAISGIAGIGHILAAGGIIHFIVAIKKSVKNYSEMT